MDLGLPDIEGMEVLEQARRESDVPVIIVSARGMEQEKVPALDAGVDDYVMKPFNAAELLARIRVALRHRSNTPKQEPIFELDYFHLDFKRRKSGGMTPRMITSPCASLWQIYGGKLKIMLQNPGLSRRRWGLGTGLWTVR